MRISRIMWLLFFVFGLAGVASAQYDAPAESCMISASAAFTWMEDKTSVIQLEGPISIDLDKNHATAQNAVIWITPPPSSMATANRVEIALIGEAIFTQPNGVTRSGQRLFIEARVREVIRLTVPKRVASDQSQSDFYKAALGIRPVLLKGGEPSGQWVIAEEGLPATQPTSRPAAYRSLQPVSISARSFATDKTPDGKVVAIASGNVTLIQKTHGGDFLELQADSAVIFTPFASLTQLRPGEQIKSIEEAVTGVYLEGDVRIFRTPKDQRQPDQQLTANRAFYDFTADRAILTDVVLQMHDPKIPVPVVVRAQTVRQLSLNEYRAEKGNISTSSFHTPTYAIGASSIYVRQTDIENEITGTRTHFVAKDATFDLWGQPVFYLPVAAGSMTERDAMRNIQITNTNTFGFGVETEWGLFETLGKLAPRGTDISYRLDYFADRGPAGGFNGKYAGGYVTETELAPWSYSGDFKSYMVVDHGIDRLGRERLNVDPAEEFRGRIDWRHQHFFPNDWQVQVRVGYISDPTFLEEWFRGEFRDDQPLETSVYAKHQRDSEAYTFLLSGELSDFATVAEVYQEQAEIQRLPEMSYRRIGDSVLGDIATFFSDNTLSGLQFKNSSASLAQLGFRKSRPGQPGFESPGIPSFGQTGTPEDMTWRGDTRQELDFPFSLYRFRVVPYIIGRYTEYSESVDGGTAERVYAGAGMRVTTAFWKVDDSVESRLFDLHRLRHVIEPELNLYTSVQSKDRAGLLLYDEQIDEITDISAVQIALNQRWQTKRGGPGNWRSIDVFTLNIQGNYFFNQPPELELNPADFRGLYFVSMPEASVPRNGVNAQTDWRITDSVSLLSEIYFNTDKSLLATASVGLSVRHDTRLSYYLGLRHIGLDFTETTFQNGQENTLIFDRQDLLIFAMDYQLTRKYRLNFAQSYDIAQSRNDRSTASLIRKFDRFFVSVSMRVDNLQNESAFFVNLWPEGIAPGSQQSAQNPFGMNNR